MISSTDTVIDRHLAMMNLSVPDIGSDDRGSEDL